MAGIGDAGAALLVSDLAVELQRHAGEIRFHHLDLRHAPTLLVDLEASQPDQRVTGFHGRFHSTQRTACRCAATAHRARRSRDASARR
jgi:hypothetical protein